jgi:hypothetical protein
LSSGRIYVYLAASSLTRPIASNRFIAISFACRQNIFNAQNLITMKKQSMRMTSRARNRFFAFTVTAILLSASASLQAQSNETVKPAAIRHLGNTTETMQFQVKFDNEAGDKFAVVVRDQDNNVLFQEFYTDKNFDRKFSLPKVDNNKVIFQIKSLKSNAIQTYEVNTNVRMVEEVIVKRVD